MSIHLRRIAAGLAVAVVTMLGSAPAYASAAASPDINPVSCASAATWVRLYSAIREHTHTHGHLRHDHEPHAAHAAHPEIKA